MFLYHAIQAGLDMGIVNAGMLGVYDEIPKDLRERVEDVLLNRRPDADRAAPRGRRRAQGVAQGGASDETAEDLLARRAASSERLTHALVKGIDAFVENDTEEAQEIAEAGTAAAQHHRGPADGRHARRRRPLRRGKDVPSAGREVRARHEEVRRLPHAVHGGGEAPGSPPPAARREPNGTIVIATVKGDVHDIGKNIVGVVLAVQQLRGRRPRRHGAGEKILATAREVEADVIGLSGLITPASTRWSTSPGDEAPGVHGAAADRGRHDLAAHTAVKIDPRYDGPVVWVKDASRSVPVTAALLHETNREKLLADVKADYDSLRARHAAKSDRPLAGLDDARAARTPISWEGYRPPRPRLLLQQDHDVSPITGRPGASQHVRVFRNADLAELRRYIDWQPFFNAWEMKGSFPEILDDADSGETARRLYDDAQQLLDRLVDERWLTAHGVVGLFPASAVGDDIEVYLDERRDEPHAVLPAAQQGAHRAGVPNRCLADYVAPKETGIRDYVGLFAVTAGIGTQERIAEFKRELDDYSGILLESLADRLAEAFAERMHERVRRELWGYAPDEHLDQRQLLKEQYPGIRPAPGYPASPDHTEKQALWELLDVTTHTGIELTESMAMWPGASVSGLYLSHPESQYFVVGRLGPDQVDDYAARKGWSLAEAERWLSPNLGYDPED